MVINIMIKKNNNDDKIREQVDRLGRPTMDMLKSEIAWHERRESYLRLARGILLSLVATAATILTITNLWVTVLQVDGSSMNPHLGVGEIVIATRNDEPAQYDVIAFYHNNKLKIKRVIGRAGDTVNIDSSGAVFINGNELDEPYVINKSLGQGDVKFPFEVPLGTVFVLGDNRADSMDSRDTRFGPLPREQIIGKVVFSLWPLRSQK